MDSTPPPNNSSASSPAASLQAFSAHSVIEAMNSVAQVQHAPLAQQSSSALLDDDEPHVIRRVPLRPFGHIDPDHINDLAADIYQAQQSQQQQSRPNQEEQQQQQGSGSNQQHRQPETDDDYMMPELLDVSDSSEEASDEEHEDVTDDEGAGDDGSVPSLHELSDSSDEEEEEADYNSADDEPEAAANADTNERTPLLPLGSTFALPGPFPPGFGQQRVARPGLLQTMNRLIFESADSSDTTRAEELMRGLEPVSAELARRFVRAGGEAMCAVCREDLVGADDDRTPLTSVPDLSSPADAVRSPVQYLDANAHRGPPMPFEQRTPPATSADILALPCHHAFHAACLHPWLARRTTCPTCRLDLDPESLTLRMPPTTAGASLSPEAIRFLGMTPSIPLNDGTGRVAFLPPNPNQPQNQPPLQNAALLEARRLQIERMQAQAAGAQPLLEQARRLQLQRLQALETGISPPATTPTPGLQMSTTLSQTARDLSNVQQDLARVAAMLPRLEQSMRALSELTDEHLSELTEQHLAQLTEEHIVRHHPPPATMPSEPVPAPAPSEPASMPSPAPADTTSAPAPPQPGAIAGSLLDNDHLRFMLGATVPPASVTRADEVPVPERVTRSVSPEQLATLHVGLGLPGLPTLPTPDLSGTRSMEIERDFQARLAQLRAYGPGALMSDDGALQVDGGRRVFARTFLAGNDAAASGTTATGRPRALSTGALARALSTGAVVRAAPPWPPFAARGAESDAPTAEPAAGGDARAPQAQPPAAGAAPASQAERIVQGDAPLPEPDAQRVVDDGGAQASQAQSAAVDGDARPVLRSALAQAAAAILAVAGGESTPAANTTDGAASDPPPAASAPPAATRAPSALLTSDQVQVRPSVAALDAERRSIEAQLDAARRTQQGLLDRLRQEQEATAALRYMRAAPPVDQPRAARAFHLMRGAGAGAGAAPEPRRKWVCPAPKGGVTLLAWVAQREGEAGEGENDGVVRVLAVPRPRESSEGA